MSDISQMKRAAASYKEREEFYTKQADEFKAASNLQESQFSKTRAEVFRVHKEGMLLRIEEQESLGNVSKFG